MIGKVVFTLYSCMAFALVISKTDNSSAVDNSSNKTKLQTRIVQGHSVSIDEYPWQVMFLIEVDVQNTILCGGSIIKENLILTAAHCL